MSALVPSGGALVVEDAVREPARRRIAIAHRMAALGLVRAGTARARAVIADASASQDPIVLVIGAGVLRRASAWRDAAELYSRAFELIVERAPEDAGTLLALAYEARATGGDLEGAHALIDAARGRGAPLALASACEELLRGRVAEARQIERAIPVSTTSAFTRVHCDLVRAEILTELGAVAGVLQALTRLDALTKGGERFSEEALRTRLLTAWSLLQQVEGLDADARISALETAARAVRSLSRYARAFPLYRAWAEQLSGEVAMQSGGDPEPAFARALTILDENGAVFTRARVLGRQALLERRLRERRAGGKEAEARRLLFDLGAGARLAAIAPSIPATTTSMMARRSIAMRLEAAQLSDETGLEAVMEITRHLAQVRELPVLFERILDAVVRVLHADRGVLLAEEGGTLRCLAARGLPTEAVVEGGHEISFGIIREAQTLGEAILSDNALSDARFRDRQSVRATDIRSVLVAPIRTQKQTFGYLYLDRRLVDVPFDSDHQDLLSVFAVQVAVAWENAASFDEIGRLNVGLEQKVKDRTLELREKNQALEDSIHELTNTRLKLAEAKRDALEKEMTLARDIQNAILPPRGTMTTPGVALCGLVLPASICGGDFWGYTVTANGDTVIVIADVTGHGVASSLITAVTRASLDTLSQLIAVTSPARVLSILNEAIHGAARGELCATAFCALVIPRENKIVVANAGHPFPFVVDGANVSVMPGSGVRLGESAHATYDESERAFSPGERLVLYSDGIVEWSNEKGREYGARRMQKVLQGATRDIPIEDVMGMVVDDVTAFVAGQERDDDLTLVVVERVVSGIDAGKGTPGTSE